MEQNLDTNSSENFKTTSKTKRNLLLPIVLLITIIAIGSIGCLIYFKKSPEKIIPSKQNAKISWNYNPSKLILNSSEKNNNSTVGVVAMCLNGTDCKDTINSKQENPSYYTCTLDKQCSFFNGFTGVQTGNELPINNAPAQAKNTTPTPTQKPGGSTTITEPALPKQSAGSSGCFNKEELIKNALNKNELKEDPSIQCECGIQPPSNSISGSPGIVDANTGEMIPGTISIVENKIGNTWSCMEPQIRPDIIIENLVFPEIVSVNSQFSISFDYKNVGAVACLENYFQADITRTIAGQSEYLGGVGAHLLYTPPLKPDEGNTFTLESKLLPNFDIVGNYKLDITMFCELTRETHIINGVKEIHIQVN